MDSFRHVVAWPCVFLSRWLLFWHWNVSLSIRMNTHNPNPNHCKKPLWPGCSWIWTISEKRPCLDLSTLLSVGLQDLEAIPKWFLWVAIFIFQIQNGWNWLENTILPPTKSGVNCQDGQHVWYLCNFGCMCSSFHVFVNLVGLEWNAVRCSEP